MNKIDEKRLKRFLFLRKIYEITDGDYHHAVIYNEVGNQLGMDESTIENIIGYLVKEGLLEYANISDEIAITHSGVKEIEQALLTPDEPTQYFPPIISVLSGDFRGAIVNIDSKLSNVEQSIELEKKINDIDRLELTKLIEELKKVLSTVPKEKEQEAETVAWAAEKHIEMVLNEKGNNSKREITKEGLEKAAKNMVSVMPQVIPIAIQIIDLLKHIK